MKFSELEIPGVFLIEPEPIRDERGFFARTFCAREFGNRGLATTFTQYSISHNEKPGTLRGLHYQKEPHGEEKLVQCICGEIFDVVVDLRRGSQMYGRWVSCLLNAANRHVLYIPKGCAHGFQTMQAFSDVFYHLTGEYVAEAASGIGYDDPFLKIAWPECTSRIISQRDRALPGFGKELAQ